MKPPSDQHTIKKLQGQGRLTLSKGIDQNSLGLDVDLLLASTLGKKRIFLYSHPDYLASPTEARLFQEAISRRANGEPIAYILGVKEFYGFEFEVSRDVLIPRPDTELLVESVCHEISKNERESIPNKIMEIGTGSACISIAIQLTHPKAQIQALDICPAALGLAKANQHRHGTQIDFSCADALSEATWVNRRDINIVVSNPPYIAYQEAKDLKLNVKGFEPQKALFANHNGLEFYQAIAEFGSRHLQPGTLGFFEFGSTQADSVEKIFTDEGWDVISIGRDYNRKQRILICKLLPSNQEKIPGDNIE